MRFKNLIKVFSLVFALGLFINAKTGAINEVTNGYLLTYYTGNKSLILKRPSRNIKSPLAYKFLDNPDKHVLRSINNLNILIARINKFAYDPCKKNLVSKEDLDSIRAIEKIVNELNRNVNNSVLELVNDCLLARNKLNMLYAESAPKIFSIALMLYQKWYSNRNNVRIFCKTGRAFKNLKIWEWDFTEEQTIEAFPKPPRARSLASIPASNFSNI